MDSPSSGPGLDTDFVAAAREHAHEVVSIPTHDVLAAAGLIADARADVLLYLALGHSHITYNLARSRLAKIQIVFGRVGQG